MRNSITVAFLGDIFAAPGRQVVKQQLQILRKDHEPDFVIANAENAARGLGLSPDLYHALREMGIDGMTLGDHVYRDIKILPLLEDPAIPLIRPANLAPDAPGKTLLRLEGKGADGRNLYVITVLGRVFFPLPADNPFTTVDTMLRKIPEKNPLVIVEVHMEATSEKVAMAHHLDGRVAAVLGTHTHVPTADARILPGGTAFITDLGMCGPYDSCIGREKTSVVRQMRTGMYVPYGIGSGDERMCGVILTIDQNRGLATACSRFEYAMQP